MTEFSIGGAAGAGFRLIREKPLTVLAWGLLYVLIAVAPSMLLMAAFFPVMADLSSGDNASTLGALTAMNSLQPITWLASVVANAVLFCAIYRAVLRPQDDRRFYIRFGAAELWQGLLQFIVMLAAGALVLVAMIPLLIVGAGAYFVLAKGAAGGAGWGMAIVGFFIAIALLGVLWWLALRFSLAGPMTFADGQLRLMESWRLTRGHGWRLFGLSLLIVAMLMLLYLVLALVLGLVLGLGAGALFASLGSGRLEDLFSSGLSPAVIAVAGLIGLALGSVIYGPVMAVTVAPWAEAYRQLSGREVDAETFA